MTAAALGASGLVRSGTSDTRALWRPVGSLSAADQAAKRLGRLRKSVITAARLIADRMKGTERGSWAMLTLTYRDDADWEPRQISALLKAIREFARRASFVPRYVWVLELTKRLRPHYHVLLWLPRGRTLPKPDKRGWWPWGLTRIEWARRAVGYLAKYASKFSPGCEDAIPRGARLHGNGGLLALERAEVRWWCAPLWVRQHFGGQVCDLARCLGGFLNRDTGEHVASPWRVIFRGGVLVIYQKDTEPCSPST